MIYILSFPAAFLLVIVFLLPLFRYSWLSIHASSVITGLEVIPNNGANWFRLFNDERFWTDYMQTLRFAVSSVSVELILAILIALLLNHRVRSKDLVRALTLLPWALPTTVMALGWRWIFNTPYGPIEQIFKFLKLEPINILSDPNLAWISTVIGDVWKTTPFIALIILAGLQTIPDDLYEAFRLEGGKPKQAFFRITLPLLKPYITIAVLFRLAQAFGVFDLIQVMTGGGPAGSTESVALYSYLNAMRYLDFGYSSTIMIASFILLMFACVVCWFIIYNSKRLFQKSKL